jgi:Xaa-Pro aminopeptidase
MSEDQRIPPVRKEISKQELQRRWKAVRKAMEKDKLDCLIMQNNNQHLGGYTRYFTDIPAHCGYTQTVIFPLNGDMTMISHGTLLSAPLPVKYDLKSIFLPYIPPLTRTNEMDAKAAVETLKKLKVKSLGVVAPAIFCAFMYNYIKENLDSVKIKYATDLVDNIKAIKSDEEQEIIKETAKMQDILWGGVLTMVRPGVREYEIKNEIQRLYLNWGSEEQLLGVGSGPPGTPVTQGSPYSGDRVLQEGDQVCIMPEVNGAGGFYCELGRTICIGDAPKPLLDLWNFVVQMQDEIAKMLKPGAEPAKVFKFYNNELSKKGYAPDLRLPSHGQGYDLVERPSIRPEEDMRVNAGMNLAVHPSTINAEKSAYAFCCDNYLIGNSGAYRIHKTPREVFVV